jgi:NitT/TauT family transport system permease protein
VKRRRPRRGIFTDIGAPQRLLISALTFAAFVGLWLLAAAAAPSGFPPTPGQSVGRVLREVRDGTFWPDVSASIIRIAIGFALSTVLAVPLGILAGCFPRWRAGVVPFSEFVRYMPVTGFVSFSIVWLGVDERQKWFIVWMGTFFQQVLMVADDVKRVPPELIDTGRTLGLSEMSILRSIVLRAAAPRMWDSNRLALGWAWTWVVLAETVNAGHGLGHAIDLGRKFFTYDKIVGYLLVLGVIGLLTDQGLRAAGRRMFRHEQVRR